MGNGESGRLLEERLIPDGHISASWDQECDIGQMRLIKRLVLEKGNDAAMIIGKRSYFILKVILIKPLRC